MDKYLKPPFAKPPFRLSRIVQFLTYHFTVIACRGRCKILQLNCFAKNCPGHQRTGHDQASQLDVEFGAVLGCAFPQTLVCFKTRGSSSSECLTKSRRKLQKERWPKQSPAGECFYVPECREEINRQKASIT